MYPSPMQNIEPFSSNSLDTQIAIPQSCTIKEWKIKYYNDWKKKIQGLLMN
jgi:hypothetical protein